MPRRCNRRAALTDPQFWLLGYEFPTTLMLFTLDTLYILTTQKKGSFAPSARQLKLPILTH